eukprot:2890555-Prymnesium_polylepis.1
MSGGLAEGEPIIDEMREGEPPATIPGKDVSTGAVRLSTGAVRERCWLIKLRKPFEVFGVLK